MIKSASSKSVRLVNSYRSLSSLVRGSTKKTPRLQCCNIKCSRLQTSTIVSKTRKDTDIGNSSVVDGLAASSVWRKGELSKVATKFDSYVEPNISPNTSTDNDGKSHIDLSKPLSIDSEEDVQQMWKDMENRVIRRKSLTVSEAKVMGKTIGRKNIRRTDEEAWFAAGLYPQQSDK